MSFPLVRSSPDLGQRRRLVLPPARKSFPCALGVRTAGSCSLLRVVGVVSCRVRTGADWHGVGPLGEGRTLRHA